MSIKVLGYNSAPFDQGSVLLGGGRFLQTLHVLQFSGSYVTGGDTLDWTNGGVQSAVPPAQSGGTVGEINNPVQVQMDESTTNGSTLLGAGGLYVLLDGTNLTNWKVKLFKNTGGSVQEYPAGAYGSDVLTDDVEIIATWAR